MLDTLFIEVLEEFRSACLKAPGWVDLFIYRALCYKEIKNYERAFEMVDYIMAISENQAEALLIKSEIYKEIGQLENYQKSREEALKINPNLQKMFI